MDPNQRKTLEIAYEAVNMAGIDMPSLKRQSRHIGRGLRWPTVGSSSWPGCFVGVSGSEWGCVPHATDAAGCGSAEAIIANRVNFSLNLKGASQTINTACSAGLVVPRPRLDALYDLVAFGSASQQPWTRRRTHMTGLGSSSWT